MSLPGTNPTCTSRPTPAIPGSNPGSSAPVIATCTTGSGSPGVPPTAIATDNCQLGINTICNASSTTVTQTIANTPNIHVTQLASQTFPELPTINSGTPTQMYSICPSDDISRHVVQNVRQKILAGEYLDLAILLDNTSNLQPQQQKIIMIEGELVIQPKRDNNKISNIESWTDAFIVFMSIYCSLHTNLYPNLLKYMNMIRLAAKRCPGLGWKTYDEQFRLRKSQDPTSHWDIIDSELWLMYILSNQTTPGQFLPKKLSQNAILKCYAFNYNGRCTKSPCLYMHNCLKCNGQHPSIYCPSVHQNSSNAFRPRNFSSNVRNFSKNPLGYQSDFRQQRPRSYSSFMGPRQNTY